MTNEWLYVAISRCTDLNNVTFFDYDEAEARDVTLDNYFKQKIENHKKQDKVAKRKISKDNYINVQWFRTTSAIIARIVTKYWNAP